MTKATFDTWVRPTHAIAYRDGEMTVGVHSPYAKEWLENRLHTTIARTVTGIVGQSVQVQYIVKDKNAARDLHALANPYLAEASLPRAVEPASGGDDAESEDQFAPPKPRSDDCQTAHLPHSIPVHV